MQSHKNNAGFSLLEIMVALGLLALLSTAIMSISKQSLFTSARSNADLEVNSIANRVLTLLSDQSSCTNTMSQFGDLRSNNTLTSFKDNLNADLNLDSDHVKVTSINVANADKTFPVSPASIVSNQGDLKIRLAFEKTVMGQVSKPEKWFGVKVYTDPAFKVTKCYVSLDNAIDTAFDTACASLGGVVSGSDCLINGQKLPDILADLSAQIAALKAKIAALENQGPIVVTPTPNPTVTSKPKPTPSPTSSTCPGGSEYIASPDKSNTCLFSWSVASIGQSVTASGSSGGTGSLLCNSPGGMSGWSYMYNCPNKKIESCVGGSYSVLSSPSGKVSCKFSWPQGNVGQSISVTGTNGGKGTVTCQPGGQWGYTYTCSDPKTVTCPAGQMSLPSSSGGSSCQCTWSGAASGSKAVGSCTRGGSISATCSSTGTWTGITSSCP